MNKAAIKNFAVEARKKLIASVEDKAGRIGIAKENITEAIRKGEGYAVFPTHIGIEITLVGKELKQRENLVNRIQEKGYESVMEEVAYTWFNRIIAVRFMEVNDYLPSRIRVLSSETKGKFEPDIVTQAPKIDLELTPQEIEEIISLKEKNELDKLFRLLFIKQCNELGEILPELFENTSKYNKDYTEILLDISYTNEDGVIRDLLTIDEEDFLEAVEIIGWMYQYYNTEPKDETFALLKKNVRISKDRIPAATQLFTPEWIVRYMVENSLGRLWSEGHLNDDLKASWKYYLEEAEQEPEVQAKLEELRTEYKAIKPEDIKVIDPCMGSGHILVYTFDVLMQIYEGCGYTQRDAAKSILENNLFGLDIDDRAYQLAYFSVMMKARKYNRRILDGETTCRVYAIQESNGINLAQLKYFGVGMSGIEKNTALTQVHYLLDTMHDAKEYGSILKVDQLDWDALYSFVGNVDINGQTTLDTIGIYDTQVKLHKLVEIGAVIAQKYDAVITNPPYMGSDNMSTALDKYVRVKFPNSRSDLFAVFIETCAQMIRQNRFLAMVTQQTWMYLQSYLKLRELILRNDIINMSHLGPRSFEEISGEVVQPTAFVLRKSNIPDYNGSYKRLIEFGNAAEKEKAYLSGNNIYVAKKKEFSNIPGNNIAYWLSKVMIDSFVNSKSIADVSKPRQGLASGNNNRFYRLWYEVEYKKIYTHAVSIEKFWENGGKYAPVNKGGGYRKWYGNNNEVIKFDPLNYNLLLNSGNHLPSRDKYFLEGITWGKIASAKFSCRYSPIGYVFSDSGMKITGEEEKLKYICAFLLTKVAPEFLKVFSETFNYETGNIARLPIIFDAKYVTRIHEIVDENILISTIDWDSFETSWDFIRHPIIIQRSTDLLADAFVQWTNFCNNQFSRLKRNEEELNRIFIEIYGLQDELTSEVEDNNVTVRKADLQRDISSFISYAVGCILGRYSLDEDGLAYAGGDWDNSKYTTFIPDKDNIILITDEEYFDDDIVSRFVNFVKVVYGQDALEENLDYIANALGNKGDTSREVICNYFLKDFYRDHMKTYQKRPIYWLFDSGKENGFKALIYLHRYNEDTVGRVRADYLHRTQAVIENAIAHCDTVLESKASASDKAKAVKQKGKLVKQLAETRIYDQAIAHIAHQRISIDLAAGVVANYAKFQGIEISSEGKRSLKVDLLGKI